MKILVCPTGNSGIYYHRFKNPLNYLAKTKDDFNYDIESDNKFDLNKLKNYNILYLHATFAVGREDEIIDTCKKYNVKLVIDIDDYWIYPKYHHLHTKTKLVTDSCEKILSSADMVTTTTEFLKEKITMYNKNVHIVRNVLQDNPSKKNDVLTFGYLGGMNHHEDVKLMDKSLGRFDKSDINMTFCGFSDGFYDNKFVNGRIEKIKSYEVNHGKIYEQVLTGNFSGISIMEKRELKSMNKRIDKDKLYGGYYKRIWNKPVNSYLELYNELDVSLVPLVDNDYNNAKSNLKLIESAVSNKVLICSDVGDYKNVIDYRDDQDNGFALKVSPDKNGKGWLKAMNFIKKEKKLLNLLSERLNNYNKEIYNFENTQEERYKLFKEL